MISSRVSLLPYDTECISKHNKHCEYKSPFFVQLSQGKIIRRNEDDDDLLEESISDNDADISNSLSEDEYYYTKTNELNKKRYLLTRSKTFMKSKHNSSHKLTKGSFRKFKLMKNIFSEKKNCDVSPIHKYLPYHKKNDENYKHNLLRYLRHRSFPYARTQYKFNMNKIKDNNNNNTYNNNNFNNYNSNINTHHKIQNDVIGLIKKYRSVKKIYKDQFCFYKTKVIEGNNINTYPVWFTFYNDKDIGLKHKWQEPLQVAELDDDVETDAEQLYYSEKKIFKDLKGGINDFTNLPNFCRNLVKYNNRKKDLI